MTYLEGVPFPCIHCGRNLVGEDLQLTVFLHGIFFLEGKNDGFFGTTCPICLKTTYVHANKNDFEEIKQTFSELVDFWGQQIYKPLGYFSPYISSPLNNPLLKGHSLLFYHSNVTSDIDVTEECIALYEDENILEGEQYYRTYIDGLAPPLGSFFCPLWLNTEQVKEVLAIEEKTDIRIFPRYLYGYHLLETVENFCWQHRLAVSYYKDMKKRMEGSLEILQKYLPEEAEFVTPDVIDIFSGQHEEKENKDISTTSVLHEILLANPDPLDGPVKNNAALMTLWKTPYPFRYIENHEPLHSVEYKIDVEAEAHYEKVCEELTQCFNKSFAQEFLRNKADDFISEYLDSVKKASWSYADFWALKTRYLDEYHYAVKIGLRNEAKYAFYKEGEAWKIIFNGKPITGLRPGGFKYIHFLVCHKNESFSHMELNSFDSPTAEDWGTKKAHIAGPDDNTDYGIKYENTENLMGRDDSYSFVTTDQKTIHALESELRELADDLEMATSKNLEDDISEISDQIKKNKKRLDECRSKSRRIKIKRGHYKVVQDRIGNAITRAIKQLEKDGYKEVSKHFSNSIIGFYGNKISYNCDDPDIQWHI